MGTFSALQAICAGNSLVTGEFPAQRPVTRSFDVFFDLHLNKPLSKQWWGYHAHYDVIVILGVYRSSWSQYFTKTPNLRFHQNQKRFFYYTRNMITIFCTWCIRNDIGYKITLLQFMFFDFSHHCLLFVQGLFCVRAQPMRDAVTM